MPYLNGKIFQLLFNILTHKFDLVEPTGVVAKFWNVGTEDAITLRFVDAESRQRNLFINDGWHRSDPSG
jgi:hypothetical protein